MEPNVTNITGVSLIFTISLCIFLLVLPRRYALIPLFISGCYMTLGQVLVIGPLHFTILRILLFVGWIRIILRKEITSIKYNNIDNIMIVWIVTGIIIFLIGREPGQHLTERLGAAYTDLGIYFIIRALIKNYDDVVRAAKYLSIVVLPLAILILTEYATGRNPFSLFGGIPEFSAVRDGKLRCQGPFKNSILAGTFGATAMPLFVGLWYQNRRDRFLAAISLLAASFIVIASSSSGPLIAYILGIIGLLFWPFRSGMRIVRWGILLLLLMFHMIMKAPVWFLIARISDVIGGGGWHRAALIDAAIKHFGEWWLVGTANTANWMPTGLEVDPNNSDITNQFILEGVKGGIVRLLLFVWLIVACFKVVGVSISNTAKKAFTKSFMIWSVGCVLVGHVASFFSVTYFDQIIIFFYFDIAVIALFNELNISDSKSKASLAKRLLISQMGHSIIRPEKL